MKSIRDLYKVGKGPSSSHTMGPERAARIFKQENPGAERYEVTLYGSLALTGVGHGTDRVLSEVLAPTPTEIIFSKKDPGDLRHPNTLDFAAYKGEEKFASMRVESIGGGDIVIEGREAAEPDDVYPENSFAEIAQYCRWRYISLREYTKSASAITSRTTRGRRSGTFCRPSGAPCAPRSRKGWRRPAFCRVV